MESIFGDMSIQMRRRDVFGGWGEVWHTDVLSGQVITNLAATSDALNKRPLNFKIFNADGDAWHAAATWD